MRIPRFPIKVNHAVGVFAVGVVCLAFQALPVQAAVPNRPANHGSSQVTAFADRYQSNRYGSNWYGRDERSMTQCTTRFGQTDSGYRSAQRDSSCSTNQRFGGFLQ